MRRMLVYLIGCFTILVVAVLLLLSRQRSELYIDDHRYNTKQSVLDSSEKNAIQSLLKKNLFQSQYIVTVALEEDDQRASWIKFETETSVTFQRYVETINFQNECRMTNDNTIPTMQVGLVIYCPEKDFFILHSLYHKRFLVWLCSDNKSYSSFDVINDGIIAELRHEIRQHGKPFIAQKNFFNEIKDLAPLPKTQVETPKAEKQ